MRNLSIQNPLHTKTEIIKDRSWCGSSPVYTYTSGAHLRQQLCHRLLEGKECFVARLVPVGALGLRPARGRGRRCGGAGGRGRQRRGDDGGEGERPGAARRLDAGVRWRRGRGGRRRRGGGARGDGTDGTAGLRVRNGTGGAGRVGGPLVRRQTPREMERWGFDVAVQVMALDG